MPDQPLSVGEDYLVLPASGASPRGIIAQSGLITFNIDNYLNANGLTLSFRVLLPPVEVSSQDPVAVLLPTSQLQHQQQTIKAVNWTTTLTDDQLLLTVVVVSPLGRISIEGLLDTGADVTIIAVRDWPDAWPKEGTVMSTVDSAVADHAVGEGHTGAVGCKAKDKFITSATGEQLLPRLNWLTQKPILVDQWLLPTEKLRQLEILVQEQLDLGHIAPSTSPWNSPIFVIKKASGKWRLLHDLRKINDVLEPMGPV
ncbi:hypothetical protein WISP_41672 [Willisornis vidua]|uniref:Peptidase A2 domain-containing protein n=1 Tax=Willisornis vidua TaxID=1566151 RepID=A0ABQ9DMX2_9PASS|nr:hypothetical protein WISP_41672 [Willisornis vidua]